MTGKRLISIVGPTAVGKTWLSVRLAHHFGTEIISADSRQFYREMHIGTAKPSPAEQAGVRHHFVDSHSIIHTIYSAGDFEREALQTLQHLFQTHDTVIMVGGSGLFVRAVTEGLDDLPVVPAAIRQELNASLLDKGLAALQQELMNVDPVLYAAIDVYNPQRVIRALEVYRHTGTPLSAFQIRKEAARPFQVVTIGLNMDRAALYERINYRVDQMMQAGLLEEARALLPFRQHPALRTVGYTELFAYLDGSLTLEEAVLHIKQNSRRYAKRQITWFSKYGQTQWFAPTDMDAILHHLCGTSAAPLQGL